MSKLHSKFKLTVQEEAPPASCPPKKPAPKAKADKKSKPKEELQTGTTIEDEGSSKKALKNIMKWLKLINLL